MKKLLTVLVVVFVLTLAGCNGNKVVETDLRVTQHESGEVTICVFDTYEDGTEEYTCDMFLLDNSELEDRIAALEGQVE